MDDGQMGIYKEGDVSVHAGIKAGCMSGINPLLRFSKLKLAAYTGVRAVSFSYWYNLFLQFLKTQMVSNTGSGKQR